MIWIALVPIILVVLVLLFGRPLPPKKTDPPPDRESS